MNNDGWTTDPPTKPGKYWFFGNNMMGAMGIDHTDKAECKIRMHLVDISTISNGMIAVSDGHFIRLKRFEKGNRGEGYVGWWKEAEMPSPPSNYEEAFNGFLIELE